MYFANFARFKKYRMFIQALGHYVPEEIVSNDYFEKYTGLTDEWIKQRTGISERRKAAKNEFLEDLSIAAMQDLSNRFSIDFNDIDLLISAGYTPEDTVGTTAHRVQRKAGLSGIKAINVNTACSSFVNASEVAQTYFLSGKSSRALVLPVEKNFLYSNDNDKVSGHLWGDGAGAVLYSAEKDKNSLFEVIDIETYSRAEVGKGPDGVILNPVNGGIKMPYGKDVFVNACKYLASDTINILNKNGYSLSDLSYLAPHQANIRILENVRQQLKLPKSGLLSNLHKYGNTGCAGATIALSENFSLFTPGQLIVVAVFGGGYSSGTMLLKRI